MSHDVGTYRSLYTTVSLACSLSTLYSDRDLTEFRPSRFSAPTKRNVFHFSSSLRIKSRSPPSLSSLASPVARALIKARAQQARNRLLLAVGSGCSAVLRLIKYRYGEKLRVTPCLLESASNGVVCVSRLSVSSLSSGPPSKPGCLSQPPRILTCCVERSPRIFSIWILCKSHQNSGDAGET